MSGGPCLLRPPCPAPSGHESDRKQKLPDIAQGEARQNQQCYFGTWLIPPSVPQRSSLRAPPTSSSPALCLPRGDCGVRLDVPWHICGGAGCCLKLLCLLDPSSLAKMCGLLWNRPSGVLGGQGAPFWWELADRVKDGRWLLALPLLRCSQDSCQPPLPWL